MPRKKQSESTEVVNQPAETPAGQEGQRPVDMADEIEGASATIEEPKKQWTKRPDPFGIESIRWQDGYSVGLKESDSNREIYVQFGQGIKADTPKNFEAIKKMFREEYKMYWDSRVQGWAKEIKLGLTPLIKEQNKSVRAAVEEAFYKAVELEEAARGPSLSEHGKHRSGRSM